MQEPTERFVPPWKVLPTGVQKQHDYLLHEICINFIEYE
jgi:hypothetical protein